MCVRLRESQRVELQPLLPPSSVALPGVLLPASPSLRVVMHSAALSRGAGDCHGHDVISRLLSAVIC